MGAGRARIRQRAGGLANTKYQAECSAALPAAECEAWVALFDATNGTQWSSCNSTRLDPCACDDGRSAVMCANDHVTELFLENMNLQGSLPAAITNLTAVTRLELYGNKLTGLVPPLLWAQYTSGEYPNMLPQTTGSRLTADRYNYNPRYNHLSTTANHLVFPSRLLAAVQLLPDERLLVPPAGEQQPVQGRPTDVHDTHAQALTGSNHVVENKQTLLLPAGLCLQRSCQPAAWTPYWKGAGRRQGSGIAGCLRAGGQRVLVLTAYYYLLWLARGKGKGRRGPACQGLSR